MVLRPHCAGMAPWNLPPPFTLLMASESAEDMPEVAVIMGEEPFHIVEQWPPGADGLEPATVIGGLVDIGETLEEPHGSPTV